MDNVSFTHQESAGKSNNAVKLDGSVPMENEAIPDSAARFHGTATVENKAELGGAPRLDSTVAVGNEAGSELSAEPKGISVVFEIESI